MNIDIIKRDGTISIKNLQCDCGYEHHTPDIGIHIKHGITDGCPDLIAASDLGKSVLIIADGNTWDIAASTVEKRLTAAGYSCRVCVLPGGKVEPVPEMTQTILGSLGGADFLLGVGSGVITDLTRQAAYKAGLPFAVFGTAASMDAYTSVTSSMAVNGMKVSHPGKAAKLLMFDPAVLASAPMLMQAGGVGDMLAKYSVIVDWKLGSAVSGETFCPLCEHILLKALDNCYTNIEEIAMRSEKGMEALIESLILGGLTMLIVGETRPCSSLEHNIAHYLEMCHLAYGTPAPSHGISAGLGLLYALMFHDILKNVDIAGIDKESIKKGRMTREEKRALINDCFPEGVGEDVMRVNKYWYFEWPDHERRIDSIIKYHEQYKKDCGILPDYRDIAKTYGLFGAPKSATEAGIDAGLLKKALLCTKDFRPRYNCATALSELGMLEESVERVLEIEKTL